MKSKLGGIFPSITTPFTDGRVNTEQLADNIEKYNGLALGGYMILGGNGEYLGLTPKETRTVAETITQNAREGVTIVAGAGRESADATVAFIRDIADLRIDIASVITPYYYAKYIGEENLIAYYTRVADLSPIPILIYNSPSYAAGVTISPQAAGKLSRHENIVGMKNSSGVPISEYISEVAEEETFFFHSGKAARCYRDLCDGAVGATLSMAIYWPEVCIQLYDLFTQGKHNEAQRLGKQIEMLNSAGPSKYGVPGVKYAMGLRGYHGGETRLPLLPLSEAEKAQLDIVFKD